MQLYEGYYGDAALGVKRHITAEDTALHMREMLGSELGEFIDVGAGNGALLSVLAESRACSSMSALEISASGVDGIMARADLPLRTVQQFDGYEMPFEDHTFDTAACVHVVEHVEHERRFLQELGRIAQRVYIEVPLEAGLRGRINRRFGHINYYTPMTFINLLETSGLRVVASRVMTHSRTYEQLAYGKTKGAIRNTARNVVLKVLGQRRAPEFMTFLMGVVIERDPSQQALPASS
jgi:ubiquinone/menaquinone biosynthesis C-methylase UbiE